MKSDFFAFISRMKYIARWSLMRSTVQENIQEHSHMVAVLAHALGLIRRDVLGQPCDAEHLAAVALYHDAPEILTGDLPTPIKYHSASIKNAYDEVETVAVEKLLTELPDALRPAYRALLTAPQRPEEYELVKAADRLAAYIKCVEKIKEKFLFHALYAQNAFGARFGFAFFFARDLRHVKLDQTVFWNCGGQIGANELPRPVAVGKQNQRGLFGELAKEL